MHHIGTVTKSSRLPALPFHAQCSCGTAGSFFEAEQARQYLRNHGLKVQAEGVTNTFALVDNSDKPEEKAALPKPHVAGVGNMPTSHAALGEEVPGPSVSGAPPAPPAPPDAKKVDK
jgi:hypothetical protein